MLAVVHLIGSAVGCRFGVCVQPGLNFESYYRVGVGAGCGISLLDATVEFGFNVGLPS